LFQGNSCFPLSPCGKDDKEQKDKKDDKKLHVISKNDQVKVILKDLGIQSDHDLSFITSEHAIQYVRELESSHSKSSSDKDRKLKERSKEFK
jgi:hypothetical protein